MTKIEIVDDSGDEFSMMDIPIPFYIRCKLEAGLTKYRVKILDEAGGTRGYYTGTSSRDYLELHVPVIPLRSFGKIFVEVEIWNEDLSEMSTHTATIEYVDQETYDSMKEPTETEEPLTEEIPQQQTDPVSEISNSESSVELSDAELQYLANGEDQPIPESMVEPEGGLEEEEEYEDVTITNEEEDYEPEEIKPLFQREENSAELTNNELAYLARRDEILGELDEIDLKSSNEEEE
jgi:hypothetical protein